MLNITQFYNVRNREMLMKNKIPPRSIFHIIDIVRGLKTELLPQGAKAYINGKWLDAQSGRAFEVDSIPIIFAKIDWRVFQQLGCSALEKKHLPYDHTAPTFNPIFDLAPPTITQILNRV